MDRGRRLNDLFNDWSLRSPHHLIAFTLPCDTVLNRSINFIATAMLDICLIVRTLFLFVWMKKVGEWATLRSSFFLFFMQNGLTHYKCFSFWAYKQTILINSKSSLIFINLPCNIDVDNSIEDTSCNSRAKSRPRREEPPPCWGNPEAHKHQKTFACPHLINTLIDWLKKWKVCERTMRYLRTYCTECSFFLFLFWFS